MNPQLVKYLAYAAAAGLAAVAALDIPELAEQVEAIVDGALLAAAGALFGWSGLKRPGDKAPEKPAK